MPANDMSTWCRVAKEPTYHTLPPQIVTVTPGTPPGGTYTLTWHGLATATIALGATAASVQVKLRALVGMPQDMTVTGTDGGPYTVTIPGWAGQLALTATSSLTGTGAAIAITGGPVWAILKLLKFDAPEYDTAVDVPEEMRNAPWGEFVDSETYGGAKATFGFSAGIRADQAPIFHAMNGFSNVRTGSAGLFTQTQTPTSTSSARATYAVQVYDGLGVSCIAGFVGTSLDYTFGGGDKGDSDQIDVKGWGCLPVFVTDTITVTMPSDTTFRRISPTTTATGITLGGTANAYLRSGKISWTWDSEPLYTRTGTRDPRRPKYKKAAGTFELTFLFDDATELQTAVAAALVGKAWVLAMPGVEPLPTGAPTTVDSITITLPAGIYTKPKIALGDGTPELTLTGKLLYDSTTGAPIKIVTVNATGTLTYGPEEP